MMSTQFFIIFQKSFGCPFRAMKTENQKSFWGPFRVMKTKNIFPGPWLPDAPAGSPARRIAAVARALARARCHCPISPPYTPPARGAIIAYIARIAPKNARYAIIAKKRYSCPYKPRRALARFLRYHARRPHRIACPGPAADRIAPMGASPRPLCIGSRRRYTCPYGIA